MAGVLQRNKKNENPEGSLFDDGVKQPGRVEGCSPI